MYYDHKKTIMDSSLWHYESSVHIEQEPALCYEKSYAETWDGSQKVETVRTFYAVEVEYGDDGSIGYTCPETPDDIKQMMYSVSEDTQSNIHVNGGNDYVETGETETEFVYAEEIVEFWNVSPMFNEGNDFVSDINNVFNVVENRMSGHEAFDEDINFAQEPDLSAWSKTFKYEDYSFNKDKISVKRTGMGLWSKVVTPNDGFGIPQDYCLESAIFEYVGQYNGGSDGSGGSYQQYDKKDDDGNLYDFESILDGELFSDNGNPLDYWLNDGDRGGDAVWRPIDPDYVVTTEVNPCDIQYSAWDYRGNYYMSSDSKVHK